MGKILTYLGIDEAGQTRNILDAERLLEGMQSLYANSPEGKKKDSFAVPLAEMTKTFIEQVKGIKPKEKPKEEQVFSGDEAKELAQLLAGTQNIILKTLEVTPSIVLNNNDFQKKYILAMQNVILAFFSPDAPPKVKNLGEYIKTLSTSDEAIQNLTKELGLLARKLEEDGEEFDADLVDNFIALYNIYGAEYKEKYIRYYELTKYDIKLTFLDPALFESLMEVTESPDNQGGTSTTLPSFIKPISYDKPSKPQKPSKPSKPSKPKFKIGDKYSLLVSNAETTFTIEDVEIDNIKIRYADGSYGNVEINNAESYVKNRVWKKIEAEFKVGDVYYSETFKQKLTITKVEEDKIYVHYEDDTEESYTPTYCRLNVSRKDWIKVVDEEMPEQEFKVGDRFYDKQEERNVVIRKVRKDGVIEFYSETEDNDFLFPKGLLEKVLAKGTFVKLEGDKSYKVGDNFITADNQDLTFKIDFIQPDSIGVVYLDGLTAIINPEDFKKGLKSGYYKPYSKPEEETDLYFKEGDVFIDKKTKNEYFIVKVNKNLDVVMINKQEYTIPYVQGLIKKGNWIKKEAKPSKPSSKPTTPTTLSDKDKQIKHILDINIEDIDF